jgi:hypothetical protein
MQSWTVQLLTILGVAVGATTSFVSTRLVDRARWQREEALRWDARRLDGYDEFAVSVKRHIIISQRLCAGLGLPVTSQPIDATTGLALLADAEEDLSVKWERVLMLGIPDAIAAAQDWRHVAWHLEALARGVRDDPAEYLQTMADSGVARKRFYTAVRSDLGIVTGTIPDRAWPPAWAQATQQSPDFRSVVPCAGIRPRSDQSVTSDASLPAVHARPDSLKVVRPGGSQRGSQRHAPWSQLIVFKSVRRSRPSPLLPGSSALGEWVAKQDHPAHIPRPGRGAWLTASVITLFPSGFAGPRLFRSDVVRSGA